MAATTEELNYCIYFCNEVSVIVVSIVLCTA